jgi:hypothetical protein
MVSAAQIVLDRVAACVQRRAEIREAIMAAFEVTMAHGDLLRRCAVVLEVARLLPRLRLRANNGRDCGEVRAQVVALGAWPVNHGNARLYRGIRKR